ncbi:MAG: winged helix-turn-helix transcriptional regulator [Chloroflexi bacterium]|nr:winged helix-turn-helix transcriptional regulator [Chloroflexota bacterium]
MSEQTRRAEILEQIVDLEPEMLRVLGPAQARDWVDVDLTMSQLKMLFVLLSSAMPDGSHGLRVSEVARCLGVTLPTVTAVMDKLVERGLVRRDDDPLDRRQHVCRLTGEGQVLIDRLMAGRRAFTTALLAYLDDDELCAFLNGMQMLLEAAKRLRSGEPAPYPTSVESSNGQAPNAEPTRTGSSPGASGGAPNVPGASVA